MSERELSLALFVLYLFTVVGRISYIFGKMKGEDEYCEFQKRLLGVGSVWVVGEDGRMHPMKEEQKSDE